jgi:hypothetical protein
MKEIIEPYHPLLIFTYFGTIYSCLGDIFMTCEIPINAFVAVLSVLCFSTKLEHS